MGKYSKTVKPYIIKRKQILKERISDKTNIISVMIYLVMLLISFLAIPYGIAPDDLFKWWFAFGFGSLFLALPSTIITSMIFFRQEIARMKPLKKYLLIGICIALFCASIGSSLWFGWELMWWGF